MGARSSGDASIGGWVARAALAVAVDGAGVADIAGAAGRAAAVDVGLGAVADAVLAGAGNANLGDWVARATDAVRSVFAVATQPARRAARPAAVDVGLGAVADAVDFAHAPGVGSELLRRF